MKTIVAGPDDSDIATALEDEGATVTRLEGMLSRPVLEEAGVVDAALYVLTDVTQATTIPIVYDLNETARLVVYAEDTIPEFVRGQIDLAIDPNIVEPGIVAEELTETE